MPQKDPGNTRDDFYYKPRAGKFENYRLPRSFSAFKILFTASS